MKNRTLRLALALVVSVTMAFSGIGGLSAQETRDPDTTPSRPGTPDVDVTPDKGDKGDKGDPSSKGNVARGNDGPGTSVGNPGLTTKLTKDIAETLDHVTDECSTYKPVYRIDCIRQGILATLARLPKTGEYAEARKILQSAAAKLDRIVVENADPDAPALLSPPNANPKLQKRRRYSAIKKEKLAKANKQALAVIEEARTELLRSSENSERRYAHYQEIALAVGSTKVLLRSS